MDIQRIIKIIEKKNIKCKKYSEENIPELSRFFKNVDVKEYLLNCLSENGFMSSGVNIKGLSGILDEIMPNVAPGGFIFPYGYLVIATSIGGNAICFDLNSNNIYWADHSCFFDDMISYKDQDTGDWEDVIFNSENIKKALVLLSSNIEEFLIKLIDDKLTVELENLD